jgi:alginate O-acetyltransferase complex protein AlgI
MQPRQQNAESVGLTTQLHQPGAASIGREVAGAGAEVRKLAVLVIQVALTVFLIRQFQIEGRAFSELSLLCACGFVVHSLLPIGYRPPFFLLLSLAAAILVLGATAGAWLISLVLLLIGLCHLPTTFPRRVMAVIAAGAALAVTRAGWLPGPWPRVLWPILGSMLMFRLIIYLYDLRHDAGTRSPWQTLAYFFMLPNVCFALFPVVDYKTFVRTYYDDDPYQIYQVGVERIARGICHLLLYRIVYYYWTLAPSEVTSPWSLAQFLVTNFALYLRVSGTFHLIVGMLRLFGYNLPDTHNFYFLSSSIGDVWRRINIYWKDFMQKIFFYPAFFALRRRGTTPALLLSTVCVVSVTWLLHSYQWFWIGGTFPITWQDAAFWSAIGIFMLLQTGYLENPRRPAATRRLQLPLPGAVIQVLRVAATFALMCVLWSLWTCESFDDWVSVWSALGTAPLVAGVGVVVAVVALYVGAVMLPFAPRAADRALSPLRHTGTHRPFWQAAGMTSVALAGLCLLSLPATYLRLGRQVSTVVNTLRKAKLNRLDAAKMQRGYYEELFNAARLDSPLWKVQATKPADWVFITSSPAGRFTRDIFMYELVPSTAIIFKGEPFHVNQWGMRDKEYTLEKPPGTYRIAVVGSSHVMGSGVADGDTFESLVEQHLNRNSEDRHYELLNFAVGGYTPLQEMAVVERKVFKFGPDAVFYFEHKRELNREVDSLLRLVRRRIRPPYPFLTELLHEADVHADTPLAIGRRRLRPFRMRLLKWTYQRIVELCRSHGVRPVWIFLPIAHERDPERLLNAARTAGFTTLDLSGVYDGYDRSSLAVAPWDQHPNRLAQQLIADRLYASLEQRPDLLGLPKPAERGMQGDVGR